MNILLTGSIAFDYLMKFPGNFREHILPDKLECLSLSFLVESLVRQRGGIAPNIAYTLALLGQRPRLFATAGEDLAEYRLELEQLGIDASGVRIIPNEYTATSFATLSPISGSPSQYREYVNVWGFGTERRQGPTNLP